MRDNHKGMPEIIDAFIDDEERHTGVIAIEIDGEIKNFRFGVSLAGYHALKKILQLRPFEVMRLESLVNGSARVRRQVVHYKTNLRRFGKRSLH